MILDCTYYVFDGTYYSTARPLITPNEIVAGDSFDYTVQVSDYPADQGWTLTIYINGASNIVIPAQASGSLYEVKVLAHQTSQMLPGVSKWIARVSNTSDQAHTVGFGEVLIRANLATQAVGDGLSHAQRCLTMIEACLEGRYVEGVENFAIAGQSVTLMKEADLRVARAKYAWEVMRERFPQQTVGKTIQTVFVPRTIRRY